jgi:hypothetical protein
MAACCNEILGTIALHEPADWLAVLQHLHEIDLAATAKEKEAFQRARGVPSAEALLRLVFAYALSPLSLRGTAAWASQAGVAELGNESLLERLRNAAEWLESLWTTLLHHQIGTAALPGLDLPLRIIDATCVSSPRSKGTDFRLHVDYRPQEARFGAALLTDGHGSEGFHHFTFKAGELAIADRGYAKARGLRHVLDAGAQFLIRIGWRSLALLDQDGEPFNVLETLKTLSKDRIHSLPVQVAVSNKKRHAFCTARLILAPLPPEAAEKSRRKATAKASHQGRQILPQGAIAAGWLMLLTSLDDSAASPEQIVAVYRLRWQIELAFKRLKSILHFDELPAKDPKLARTWIAAILIAALLVDRLIPPMADALPAETKDRQPLWGLYTVAALLLRIAILGTGWGKPTPGLRRLIEPPRTRRRQLPALLANLPRP